jgi:hypothetical protein
MPWRRRRAVFGRFFAPGVLGWSGIGDNWHTLSVPLMQIKAATPQTPMLTAD